MSTLVEKSHKKGEGSSLLAARPRITYSKPSVWINKRGIVPGKYNHTKKYEMLERVGFKKEFEAGEWTDYNRQFFDRLAPKYDTINEFLSFGMHRRFKRRAIRNAGIGPGQKILDICTGSGDIAIMIAREFPTSQIIGVDLSDRMLEIAKNRAAGLRNLTFEKADALKLPFADRTFDVVFMGFGLRNLDNLQKGILEMARITKAGGRISSLDLGKPQGAFLKSVYSTYFLHVVPFLGAAFFHRNELNSFSYLAESSKYYPPQEELVGIFQELGLEDVKNFDFMFGAVAQQVGTVP